MGASRRLLFPSVGTQFATLDSGDGRYPALSQKTRKDGHPFERREAYNFLKTSGEAMSPVEMEREDDQKPDANERLEQVFDTADETEALVVRGLLESNGIECMETTLDAPQDVLPGVGGIVLSVREEQAAQARVMIEEYRNDAVQDSQLDEAAIGATEISGDQK